MITQMKTLSLSVDVLKLIREIECYHQEIAHLPPADLLMRSQQLTNYRTISSTSLQKETRNNWMDANNYVSEKIKSNIAPVWEDIIKLNEMLDSTQGGKVRTIKVYIGNHTAPPPEELNTLLDTYINHILMSPPEDLHPLIKATAVRYYLLTIHPFIDGNGRTSHLLCDWILALHGYLPLTHNSKVDSHIGAWGDRAHFSTFEFAFIKTMNAIKNSCLILLEDK